MESPITPVEFVNEWITDLRSGLYKQGRGELHSRGDQFCCIGVGCEVGVKHEMMEVGNLLYSAYYYKAKGKEGVVWGNFPPSFREWLGMSQIIESELIAMNDEHKKSFGDIADYLEDHFLPMLESKEKDNAQS